MLESFLRRIGTCVLSCHDLCTRAITAGNTEAFIDMGVALDRSYLRIHAGKVPALCQKAKEQLQDLATRQSAAAKARFNTCAGFTTEAATEV